MRLSDKDTGNTSSRHVTMCGWDDVPHLDAATKAELLSSTPPHMRDARSKGVPSMGMGSVYGIPVEDITCDPFAIPAYYRRFYGLDVGWRRTAVAWCAHDLDSDVIYIYTEHYRGEAEPSVHATAIKARGVWVPGVIDTAAHQVSQIDGRQLISMYRDLGLDLTPAINAVDSGLEMVRERLSTGRLKVFSTCKNWLAEYRIYRRDDKGKVVKKSDHLMDATRYAIVSGVQRGRISPDATKIKTTGRIIADPVVNY